MHTVVRIYSGHGASDLVDLVIRSKPVAEEIMNSVPGLIHYAIMRTEEGGVTITSCASQEASDEITRKTIAWAEEHAPDLHAARPQVIGGTVAWEIG